MRKRRSMCFFEVLRSELRGTYRPCPCHTEDLQLIFLEFSLLGDVTPSFDVEPTTFGVFFCFGTEYH